jgi:hypothetical protein
VCDLNSRIGLRDEDVDLDALKLGLDAIELDLVRGLGLSERGLEALHFGGEVGNLGRRSAVLGHRARRICRESERGRSMENSQLTFVAAIVLAVARKIVRRGRIVVVVHRGEVQAMLGGLRC